MRRILALLALLFAASPAAALPVDLELILAVDVSRSIDADEARLQREGYVQALTDPRVTFAPGDSDLDLPVTPGTRAAADVLRRAIVAWRSGLTLATVPGTPVPDSLRAALRSRGYWTPGE